MSSAPLIGFEGPIGAGKTTLAGLLARHTRYEVVMERFDENEFLSDFYSDEKRWALPMQLWFLAERHKQLEHIASRSHTPIVADYTGLKNEVFASMLLEGRELRLYEALAGSLARSVRFPDVLVYLDARNDILLERIGKRGRSYEADIDAAYLERLRRSYETHLAKRVDTRVVRIETSDLDLESTSQMEVVFSRILHGFQFTPPV